MGIRREKHGMTSGVRQCYTCGVGTGKSDPAERRTMITEALIRWAVAFVCGGVISLAVSAVKSRRKREGAISDGVQCLLRAEIIACHERYGREGKCPIYAKESLKRVYRAYHALGGNDIATGLYEQTLALPDFEKQTETEKEENK